MVEGEKEGIIQQKVGVNRGAGRGKRKRRSLRREICRLGVVVLGLHPESSVPKTAPHTMARALNLEGICRIPT